MRHQALQLQVTEKATNNVRNSQRLTKTCLISYKNVVQLKKEREAKNQKSKPNKKAVLKRKRSLPPAPPDQSSDSEVWEDEDDDIASILGNSEGSRDNYMQDVMVVAGKK